MRCKDIESDDVKVLKIVSQFMDKAKEIRKQQMSNELAPVMVPVETERLR